MATYVQVQEKYAAAQWTGNAADLDTFIAAYDPNKRGAPNNPDNTWNYTVNPDGSLVVFDAISGSRSVAAGTWMVAGPYWGTPAAGGILDYVYGPPVSGRDGYGLTDADFQARFAATT